jgi:hypothetical protein
MFHRTRSLAKLPKPPDAASACLYSVAPETGESAQKAIFGKVPCLAILPPHNLRFSMYNLPDNLIK